MLATAPGKFVGELRYEVSTEQELPQQYSLTYYEIGVVADDFVVDDSYVVAVGYVEVDGYVVVDGGDDDFVALSAWALEAGVPGRS